MSQDKNNAPTVPNGYTARFDDNYKHWYFVDLSTKKSLWEAPEGTTWAKSDDVAPPPYNPSGSGGGNGDVNRAQASPPNQQMAPQGTNAGGFQQQGYGAGPGAGPGPGYGGYPPQGYGYPPQPGYGGYPPQPGYGGYPPQQGYYQQMPPQQQQQQRRQGFGAGGMALGAGAGMLGGMMMGNAIASSQANAYADGYNDGNMNDDYGGGGDFDGGDF